MPPDRSLVRASDLGAWEYCNRAWWLAHVRKVAHEQPNLLARGQESHQRHGAAVKRAQWAQRAGLILLLLALMAAIAALILTL